MTKPTVFILGLLGFALFTSPAQDKRQSWVEQVSERQYFAVMVEDIDAASDWYQQVFELEYVWGVENNDRGIRTANFINDFIHVELVHLPTHSRNDDSFGLFKVGSYVPDVDVIADRIAESTGERPRVVEFAPLNQKVLQIEDPEGTLIQFMSTIED